MPKVPKDSGGRFKKFRSMNLANYRKTAVAKLQAVFTSTDDAKALPTDGAEAKKTEKDPAERSSRLNGSHRSAAGFTDRRKQMNSINVQKGNGHASS